MAGIGFANDIVLVQTLGKNPAHEKIWILGPGRESENGWIPKVSSLGDGRLGRYERDVPDEIGQSDVVSMFVWLASAGPKDCKAWIVTKRLRVCSIRGAVPEIVMRVFDIGRWTSWERELVDIFGVQCRVGSELTKRNTGAVLCLGFMVDDKGGNGVQALRGGSVDEHEQ